METTEIFRVTVNSLITVFSCHLSLIKGKKNNPAYPRRRRKQLQSGGKKEQFFTDVLWQEFDIKLQCRFSCAGKSVALNRLLVATVRSVILIKKIRLL